MRLALARTAARALHVLPWRWRVAAVLAAMRAMAWQARKADGACLCTACGTRLGGFIADYGAAPASRLLGIAGTANNPRLYGGAVRQSCPVCLEAERTRFLLWALAKEGVLDGKPIDLLVCSGGPRCCTGCARTAWFPPTTRARCSPTRPATCAPPPSRQVCSTR
jgi:hypothetical protein